MLLGFRKIFNNTTLSILFCQYYNKNIQHGCFMYTYTKQKAQPQSHPNSYINTWRKSEKNLKYP